MGRSISPLLLTRDINKNLDNNNAGTSSSSSSESAMRAFQSCLKELDSTTFPDFLSQVSDIKHITTAGLSVGGRGGEQHTISLYEVLARVHGPKIVPQIDNIMNTIIKTLSSSSSGASALHQACSKVVPAIARYAMDPMTADIKKTHVIHSLCKPLSDCLLDSQENLSSGAALCLQALVDSDNWRFASNEMVNEVCQRLAGALEKHSRTDSHMALVTALAEHNPSIVEAYVRLFIRTGLQILDTGFAESNSKKQLSSIHMMSSLMRCLDPKSMMSELELVIKKMESIQSNRIPLVTEASIRALQIAKKICAAKISMFEWCDMGSATGGTDFNRRENTRMRRNACRSGDQLPLLASPKTQTVDSFVRYGYFTEAPISMNQSHQAMDYGHKRVNRKLWRRFENEGIDASLEDVIFSETSRGSNILRSDQDGSENCGDHSETFRSLVHGKARNGVTTSNSPNIQRSKSQTNVDELTIFTTPRRLVQSLQGPDDNISSSSEKQIRSFRSPMFSRFQTSTQEQNKNSLSQEMNCENSYFGNSCLESVSSTEDLFTKTDLEVPLHVIPGNETQLQSVNVQKNYLNSALVTFCGILVVFLCFLVVGERVDQCNIVVPT